MINAQSQANFGMISPDKNAVIRINPAVIAVSSQFLEVSIIPVTIPAIQANNSVTENFIDAFFIRVL